MTVSSTQLNVSYTGDGSSTTFTVPFYFLLATDLVVSVTPSGSSTATTLVYNVDYTVANAHNPAGGSITCIVAPASGSTVAIIRKPPLTQLQNIVNNETMTAPVLDDALDKLTMIMQVVQQRAINLQDTDPTVGPAQLPLPAGRANTMLAFDANGAITTSNPGTLANLNNLLALIAAGPTATFASQAQAQAGVDNTTVMTPLRTKQAVIANQTYSRSSGISGPQSPAIVSYQSLFERNIDLRDWNGVDPTDNNDNAGPLQQMLNQSAASGVNAYLPPGKWAVGSTLTMPDGARLIGNGQPGATYSAAYSYLHFAHSNVGINCLNGVGAREFSRFGTYRTQPVPSGTPGVAWTPNDHNFDFYLDGAPDVSFSDLMLFSATRGIAARDGATRTHIQNLKGSVFKVGLDFSQVYDSDYFDRVHFWPFFADNQNVHTFTRANLYAYSFGRVDNPSMGSLFSFAAFIGFYFQGQASVGLDASLPPGPAAKFHAKLMAADVCTRGLFVTSANANGTEIYTPYFYAESSPAAKYGGLSANNLIEIDNTVSNARVVVDKCEVRYTSGHAIAVAGSGNRVEIGSYGPSLSVGTVSGYEFLAATGNSIVIDRVPETSAAAKYNPTGSDASSYDTPDWQTYTPTLTATTGTFTTATATGRWRRRGKTILLRVQINVTTVGTAAGAARVTIPATAAAFVFTGIGREIAVNGKSMTCTISASGGTMDVMAYDNTFNSGNGTLTIVEIEYEAA